MVVEGRLATRWYIRQKEKFTKKLKIIFWACWKPVKKWQNTEKKTKEHFWVILLRKYTILSPHHYKIIKAIKFWNMVILFWHCEMFTHFSLIFMRHFIACSWLQDSRQLIPWIYIVYSIYRRILLLCIKVCSFKIRTTKII